MEWSSSIPFIPPDEATALIDGATWSEVEENGFFYLVMSQLPGGLVRKTSKCNSLRYTQNQREVEQAISDVFVEIPVALPALDFSYLYELSDEQVRTLHRRVNSAVPSHTPVTNAVLLHAVRVAVAEYFDGTEGYFDGTEGYFDGTEG